MANVLLGVTGSVAAIKVPELFTLLRQAGHQVKVVATQASLYFFDPALLEPRELLAPTRNPEVAILDEDEWRGRAEGHHWHRGEPVLHIELRRWADVLLVAPLDANTLAKLALGITDNCLSCVWRAWEPTKPVILAPAMNTVMWQHPATARHLRQIAMDTGAADVPAEGSAEEMVDWINLHCPRLRVAMPVSKRLACDDEGMGGMAAVADLVALVGSLC